MKAYLDDKNKLKNYLKGELYCREERQFAALLYSVFLRKKRKQKIGKTAEGIIKDCLDIKNEKYKIEDVYFEATLMRDYFEREEKTVFNEKLLEFCMKGDNELKDKWIKQLEKGKSPLKEKSPLKTQDDIPYNLGQKGAKQNIAKKIEEEYQKEVKKKITDKDPNEIKNISQSLRQYIDNKSEANPILIQRAKEKLRLDIAGMMMNATPDILVQYTIKRDEDKSERTYFKALECKYKSDEGRYEDVAGANIKMQFFIQECIMFFLFGPRANGDYYKPKRPERGKIWGVNKENPNKEEVWEKIFDSVYDDIMRVDGEYAVGKRINAGVEVIRFVESTGEGAEEIKKQVCANKKMVNVGYKRMLEGEGNEKQKEIKIGIKNLLDIIY